MARQEARQEARRYNVPQEKPKPKKRAGSASDTILVISEYDAVIFGVVVILLLLGIVMILSSSYYSAMTSEKWNNNMFYFFSKQSLAVVIGFCVMLIAAAVNYHLLKPFIPIMYVVANALLVAVKFWGVEANGAKRWLKMPPPIGSFQPSEFAKVAVILLLAMYIAGKKDRVSTPKGIFGCLVIIGIPILLVLWGGNLSTAIIIATIGFGMVFVASPYFMPFVGIAAAGVAGLWYYLAFLAKNYQGARFAVWKDPFSDPTGKGYQTIQSLYAVASGGLFGLGLGQSNQKLIFMPEPYNDFIFAIICEELGFFGAMIVLLLFAILIWRSVRTALNAPDLFGTLIATGVVMLIGVQVIINVSVVTNTIPNTGIPMPFISYGGTSVAFIMAIMGVLLNISRYSKKTNA